jgi:hypothetical protein
MLADAVFARRGQLSACILVLTGWDAERKAMLDRLTQGGVLVLPLLVAPERPADAPPMVKLLVPGRIQEGLAVL